MKSVIDSVMENTRKGIERKRAKAQNTINMFAAPWPEWDKKQEWWEFMAENAQFFKDREKGRKYSIEAMEKAYDVIDELRQQERELTHISGIVARVRKGVERGREDRKN